MSTKAQITRLQQEGANICKVWTDNTDFKMGEVTVAKFTAACESLRDAQEAVEAKKLELTALINEREAQAGAVSELIVRARSGFKSVYGLDSTQYQQAGGTRKSDRKRPVRKAALEVKKAA
jgi:hypothetical protein